MQTSEITRKYREAKNLSYQGFADAVNSHLINTGVSDSKVYRWETKQYEPPLDTLFECLATYRNTEKHWIAEWAVESISSMYPDLVQSGILIFNVNKAEPAQ